MSKALTESEIFALLDELDGAESTSDTVDEREIAEVRPTITVEKVQQLADLRQLQLENEKIASEESDSGTDDDKLDPTYIPESISTEEDDTISDPDVSHDENSESLASRHMPTTKRPNRVYEDLSEKDNFSQSCKRKRDPTRWQRNIKKLKSAKGMSYTNHKGKYVAAKKIGPNCECKKRCFDKLGEDYIMQTFEEFYNIGDKSLQNSHLFGLIQTNKVKRRRARSGERNKYRQASYTYNVRKDGERIEVCAKAFRSVHGLGKSRFETLRKPDITLTPRDKRGKHGNQKKINVTVRQKVRDHIAKFPVVKSHYSREENPNKAYLPSHLNVRRMWLMYLAENESDQIVLIRNKQPCTAEVTLHLYREEFDRLNLGFGLPRSDTCSKCDRLKISKEEAKQMDNTEKLKAIESEKEQHLRKAEKAYSTLKSLSEEAKTNENLDMYTFDFQQNLPVPTLTSSDMFYSRMLWVYNFGIHDMSTGDGIMHLWDETVAKRGSSEVCSCLQSTIMSRHTNAKRLVVFSDSCCGQNKNKAIMNLWAWMSSGNPFEQIDHMYLIRGHTFLPNDRDFAQIEKYKRKRNIFLPEEYEHIIRDARTTQPFEVKMMHSGDFKDHKDRADKNVKSTLKDDTLNNIKLRDVMWFSYGSSQEMDFMENKFVTVTHPNQVWCRFTHNELEPWKKVHLFKRGATLGGALQNKYTHPLPLKEAKYKDLMALGGKGLVSPHVKEVYAALPHLGEAVTNGDSESDNGADYV